MLDTSRVSIEEVNWGPVLDTKRFSIEEVSWGPVLDTSHFLIVEVRLLQHNSVLEAQRMRDLKEQIVSQSLNLKNAYLINSLFARQVVSHDSS